MAVETIIDTALELFGSRGIRGTSIAAVADRLGLTDAGVLHHFPTKLALIDAAWDRSIERHLSRMQELLAPGGLAAIRRMNAWGEVMVQDPEITAFNVVLSAEAILHDSAIGEQVHKRYDAVHDLILGLIRQGIERGEIRPNTDAEWEARSLVAFMDGIRLQWFYSDQELDLAGSVRRYVDELAGRLAIGSAD